MATADAIDKGISGGLKVIGQRMKEMSAEIKSYEARRVEAIRSRDEARSRYQSCQMKLRSLKDQILDKEEEVRKKEEKFKQVNQSLSEKEGYIVRARLFNKAIETVPAEEIVLLETKVRDEKALLHEKKKKYQVAKERFLDLEQKLEFKENKVKQAQRRVEDYRVSLEYRRKEYGLKSSRYNKVTSGSADTEDKIKAAEDLLAYALQRVSTSTRNITALEARIAAAEDVFEKYKSQRLSMECTLRELLSSAVNMNKKKENQSNSTVSRVNATH